MADTTDEPEETRSLVIFGRDVSKIPCFRDSFLNGILGGVTIGVGTFMRTSKPRLACNVGMGSYTLITLFYYSFCRYAYSREKFFIAQVQEGMRRNALYQGTDKERKIREDFVSDMKDA